MKRLVIQMILIGAGILALLTIQAHLFETVLYQEQQLMVGRLQTIAEDLLQKAHKTKDDLMMLEVIHALAHAPGLHAVSLIDPSGKILADSQPTRLGKMIGLPLESPITFIDPLGTPASPWARLVFSISDEPIDRWAWQHWCAAGLVGMMGWLFFLFYLHGLEKKRSTLERQAGELTGLLEIERQKLQTSIAHETASEHQWRARLEAALEHMPSATLCLDERQRVVAVNHRMLKVARSGDAVDWIGRSWQEIPCLQSCGPALEQSLQQPGRRIEAIDPFPKGRLFLHTPGDSAGSLIGTWVTIESDIGD